MEVITSQQNKWVKHCKKLQKKKYREAFAEYVIEGWHLVEEALKYTPQTVKQLFMTEEMVHLFSEKQLQKYESYIITKEISQSMAAAKSAQGIFAIMQKNDCDFEIPKDGSLILLDGVQDPGNVGTIIRTADAAGYSGVVLGLGSADLYNDKVLRSMQGSQFHLPVIQVDLLSFIAELKQKQFTLYGTKLDPLAQNYREVSPDGPYALVLGNEGQGVSPEVLEQMDQNVYIPILGLAESLNVAVAGGILMYHFKNEL